MIQVTFYSKQLFEKKNEVDVSLRLPADAEWIGYNKVHKKVKELVQL